MKNISLAAKYRPQSFKELVGQETIRKVLSKAVIENKVAPAYLLSGTRGVGKTTIARILAKALNCENKEINNDGEPCNTCQTCQRITANAYVDVIEIDGASNRGIDDARRIREIVEYAPIEGKFRIIIIDEAHMLTKDAFNALLKTLEEPPQHTRFVLATTEAQKFPITILSRCQHFVFMQVSENDLANNIRRILQNENWQYEEEAVLLLAKRGAGSVRDSLSLLDQSLTSLVSGQSPLTAKLVRSVLGLAGKEILEDILKAINTNDSLAIVKAMHSMMLQGVDITHFIKEFAQIWRSLFLINQHNEKAFEILQLSEDERIFYAEYAKKFSSSFIHSAWQLTLESQRRITKSLEPSVALELFLINLSILPKLLPIRELSTEQFNNSFENENNKELDKSFISESTEAQKKTQIIEQRTESENFQEEVSHNITEQSPAKENIAQKFEENAFEENLPEDNQIIVEQKKAFEKEIEEKKFNPLDVEAFLDFLLTNKHTSLAQAIKQCEKLLWLDPESMRISEENKALNKEKALLTLTLNAPANYVAKQLNEAAFHKSLQDELGKWSGLPTRIEVHKAKAPKAKIELQEELMQKDIIKEMNRLLDAQIILCENKKAE